MRWENLPFLICDPMRMEQAFINLITNARYAVEESNKDKKIINIETGLSGSSIVVKIDDNGIGINEKNLNKIYEPFFTTKEPGKGTGLGLSLVKSIVEENNGMININSRVNEGTNVLIEFKTGHYT